MSGWADMLAAIGMLLSASVLHAAAANGAAAGDGPRVTSVCAVAPDVLAITIEARRIEHGKLVPYQKQAGDQIRHSKETDPYWVFRDGRFFGALAGAKRELLWTLDRVTGTALDVQWAMKPQSFTIASSGDEAYRAGERPVAVYRKSKPTDMGRVDIWKFDFPVAHTLYLKLPKPMTSGGVYEVRFNGGPHSFAPVSYAHAPTKGRSEAVHVSHLGFRPDDPAKRAYLSCWMGDGGGVSYGAGPRFSVIDDATGKVVHEGQATLHSRKTQGEDIRRKNHNGADVYVMDFGSLSVPGTYRVSVDGVGCSYPFAIASDVWRDAFYVSARGFYHQRSGIELKPPYTTFTRPRGFHPDDGVKVFASTCTLMDSGNGLNAKGTDKDNFGNLVKGKTNEIVPDAWGGYCDAGDWDRRIQHLNGPRYLLELVELFPQYFDAFGLNIPESGNGLSDLINEAMWGLDVYRRMQTPDGGIRGGIESAEHPRAGEPSWLESLTVMAYAPDEWSSYEYAGVAARMALVLQQSRKPDLAKAYRETAVKAMQWAEKRIATIPAGKLHHAARDSRNLAALELFRLTGDERWHRIFLETTVFKDPKADVWRWEPHHEQADAAFLYARLDRPGMDAQVKRNARAAMLRQADVLGRRIATTGLNWANQNEYATVCCGALTTPMIDQVRAHYLSQDAKYLRNAILACQSGAGANPINLCYTTGLGHASPRNPLIVDARTANLPTYPGITVYGPMDTEQLKDNFGAKLVDPVVYPRQTTWPTGEAYFDVWMHPIVCEFTVMQSIAPNAYVWGYLAARP